MTVSERKPASKALDRATENVHFRCRPGFRKLLGDAAKADDCGISELIQRAVKAYAESIKQRGRPRSRP